MNRPTNNLIIERYLNRFDSKQSIKTRKSALNYFFLDKYFGFEGHIFDINTDSLIDYFDYLKHLDTLSLGSKKTKWTLLISFLNFCIEYYREYSFIVIIPKHTIKWGHLHKEPETNKDIVMTKEEIEKILDYIKLRHFKYYLIFRVFTETGMRKGELIKIDYNKVNTKRRYIETTGKTGKKVYYISKELAKYLNILIEERKLTKSKEVKNDNGKALFLSTHLKRCTERQFNVYLRKVLDELEIEKRITCHTFRRTINTFRKLMDCPNEDRKILLNHKVQDVNVESYVKMDYKQYIELYDKWYPYQNIQL